MEDIDFDNSSDSLHPLHLALNDMDNVITDYDYYDPMTFYDIVDRIEKVMTDKHQSSTTPKKSRNRKSTSKKSTSSPTPPPHVLKQMEEAIALLNQQKGTNTTLADFDILPIELDDCKK